MKKLKKTFEQVRILTPKPRLSYSSSVWSNFVWVSKNINIRNYYLDNLEHTKLKSFLISVKSNK